MKENINWYQNLYDTSKTKIVIFSYKNKTGNDSLIIGTRNQTLIQKYTNKGFNMSHEEELLEKNNLKTGGLKLYDVEAFMWKTILIDKIDTDSLVIKDIKGLSWEGKKSQKGYKKRKEIIDLLRNHEVEIVFTKGDDSVREMTCTRLSGLHSEIDEANSAINLEKAYSSSKMPIPVYDLEKKDKRAFVFERLIKYRKKGDLRYKTYDDSKYKKTYYDNIKAEMDKEKNKHVFEEGLKSGKVLNPMDLTKDEIIKALETKVVRMVFKNNDGSLTTIYATRNKSLIKIYCKDKAGDIVDKGDGLLVYDMEKGFTSIELDKFASYDSNNNVSSWIEFEPKDDGWFKIVFEGAPIGNYYVIGSTNAKSIGVGISNMRLSFEKSQLVSVEILDSIEELEWDNYNNHETSDYNDFNNEENSGIIINGEVNNDDNDNINEGDNNNMDIIAERSKVMELLYKGHVDIIFTKSDDSERYMRATRVGGESLGIDNSKEGIMKELERGVVTVIDTEIGEVRRFVFGRLKKYKESKDTTYINYNENSADVADLALEKIKNDSNVANPVKFSTKELINRLENKVVRLVFIKKGNEELRVMYATRNPDLISLYGRAGAKESSQNESMTSEEKIKAQIDGDYVTVFEIDKREFKTFKPTTLLEYDVVSDVGSWIEFKPEDDGWFKVSLEGDNIKNYYIPGKFEAKEIGEEVSVKRVKFEYAQKDLLKARQNIKKRGDEEDRLKALLSKLDVIIKEENKKLDGTGIRVFEKMVEFAEKAKEHYLKNETEDRILTEVKILTSKKLIIFNFNLGRDVFIFHPQFALNGTTYKVYIDRTDKLKFDERARKSSTEKNFKSLIIPFFKFISGRRKVSALDKVQGEKDFTRMSKLNAILNKEADKLDKYGMKYVFTRDKNQNVALKLALQDGDRGKYVLLITPGYIYDGEIKKMIYGRSQDWRTIKEFIEKVGKNPQILRLEPERAKFLIAVLANAWDLRGYKED